MNGQDYTQLTSYQGGFPCQPHSIAGKRLASGDERDLWDEFARVIREIKPKWVLGENVRGLLTSENGRFFGRVLKDLADMGYRAGWCCFPASWVGAVHRRERVFIIGYSGSEFRQGIFTRDSAEDQAGNQEKEKWCENRFQPELGAGIPAILHGRNSKPIKPLITRMDDGFSDAPHRLKCLGNAVMRQQAYPIFKAIAEMEGMLCGQY